MHRNLIVNGRILVFSVAVAIGGALMCAPNCKAAPNERSLSAVFEEEAGAAGYRKARVHRFTPQPPREGGDPEATAEENLNDAKLFAARLKHHQGRHLAQRRQQFHKQQLQLENQRRALRQKKARMKARQFAAARRRAAEQASKHKRRRLESDGGKHRRQSNGKPG